MWVSGGDAKVSVVPSTIQLVVGVFETFGLVIVILPMVLTHSDHFTERENCDFFFHPQIRELKVGNDIGYVR